MASKGMENKHVAPGQVFECDSLPIPPGTKNHARLPRGLEQENASGRIWWLCGGAAAVALLAGLLIGRFLIS
jgi:hypothetical protein